MYVVGNQMYKWVPSFLLGFDKMNVCPAIFWSKDCSMKKCLGNAPSSITNALQICKQIGNLFCEKFLECNHHHHHHHHHPSCSSFSYYYWIVLHNFTVASTTSTQRKSILREASNRASQLSLQ